MKNIYELKNEKIPKLLLKYFVPAIVGVLVNALYNIVDRIFIGNAVGPYALAALSVAFPIMIITSGFGMLFGMGGGVLISINLGKENKEKAEKVLGNTFILLIIASIFISLIAFIIKTPMLRSFGSSENTIAYAQQYLSIILFGTVMQNIGFGMNNCIRSSGDAVIAMLTMLIGAISNIILDAVFVLGLNMGTKGAALATVIAMTINSIWVIMHFLSSRSVLKLRFENIKLDLRIIKEIVAIGMAPFAMQVAGSIVNVLFNKQLIHYGGDMAISAMGIMTSVSMLIIMSIIAINQAAQPIIGYNHGAKSYKRVKQTLNLAILSAVIISSFALVIIELFPENIIKLFTSDSSELISIGSNGLRIYLIMLPIIGYQIVGANYFQAIGKAKISMMLSLLRQVIILIPLILIIPQFWGLTGVWIAGPIADFISFIITFILLNRALKELSSKIGEDNYEENIEKKVQSLSPTEI